MFYIICGGSIVESMHRRPSQEDLQEWADLLNAHVYVIDGEHTGLTADPESADDDEE